MNRIDLLFAKLRKESKKAFIVYIAAGDPALAVTKQLIRELEKASVDLIEIGIPFSDPLADGPTIQKASERALRKGVTVKSVMEMARSARKEVRLPLVFMTYYNLVFHYGIEKFVRDAVEAGIDGVIIPDLPPEEGKDLVEISRKNNFAVIFLAAPTSTEERLKKIASETSGFIYYVSLTGTTGARENLPADIIKKVRTLKRISKKPVCVGFGISKPEQARKLSRLADGIIVGSAVIKVIENNLGKRDLVKKVIGFVSKLEKAVHGAR